MRDAVRISQRILCSAVHSIYNLICPFRWIDYTDRAKQRNGIVNDKKKERNKCHIWPFEHYICEKMTRQNEGNKLCEMGIEA